MVPDIKPHESRWEKAKAEASRFSAQVKAALITVAGAFLLSAIAGIGGCISEHSENSRLKSKVHDLELEVLPFRNLAVEEFHKADTETMKKLAEEMKTLRKDYAVTLETLNSYRLETEQLRLKAIPQVLMYRNDPTSEHIKPEMTNSPAVVYSESGHGDTYTWDIKNQKWQ